jgi:hypothetical protein
MSISNEIGGGKFPSCLFPFGLSPIMHLYPSHALFSSNYYSGIAHFSFYGHCDLFIQLATLFFGGDILQL